MAHTYDVAVLGGGPGGYEAAIRCAQYGLKTVLIEADRLGGTCLNRGCIPTKALLYGAELYHALADGEAEALGLRLGHPPTLDYAALFARKNAIVARMSTGIANLEKAHGVEVVHGFGTLESGHSIAVDGRSYDAEHIILATGSQPSLPSIPGMEHALTSDDALTLDALPQSVVIVGGGVIGIEFASLYAMLGVPVMVLESQGEILSCIDSDILRQLKRVLHKQGVEIVTSARVQSIQRAELTRVNFTLEGDARGAEGEWCILCTGRGPRTAGVGLEAVGVALARGYVPTDESMRTNVPNIFAIGDITGKAQLAHVAGAQGLVAAACCAGKQKTMRYDVVPACIYTSPEIACVGKSESELRAEGRPFAVGRFDVPGNGKGMVMGMQTGMAKIYADPETGELYGAQLFAPRATDMIAELALLMRVGGRVADLAETIHPHPTLSEIVMEAAHDLEGLCCHKPPRRSR